MSIILTYSFSKASKDKVAMIFSDIDYFNNYIHQFGTITDARFFEKVINSKYWRYLKKFSWLDYNSQQYLDNGVLTILLFMAYMVQEGQIQISERKLKAINRYLLFFNADNDKTIKLHKFTIDAYMSLHYENYNNNHEIMKSISWTLDNIILTANDNKLKTII